MGNDLLILRSSDLILEKQIPLSTGNGLILNHDGSTAYVYANYGLDQGLVYVVNLESYEITRKIEISSRINYAVLSPDEKIIYCAQDSGIFSIDIVDGKIAYLLRFVVFPQTIAVNPINSRARRGGPSIVWIYSPQIV